MMDDENSPRKGQDYEIGQSLDTLSIEELEETVAMLRAEIERLEQARARKEADRDAAAAIFLRK